MNLFQFGNFYKKLEYFKVGLYSALVLVCCNLPSIVKASGEVDPSLYSTPRCVLNGGTIVQTYHNTGSDTGGWGMNCAQAIGASIAKRDALILTQSALCTSTIPGNTRYEIYYAEGEPSLTSCWYIPMVLGYPVYNHQRGFSAVCCSYGRCGNGTVESNPPMHEELCDDGNTVSGDGCSSTCLWEISLPSPSPSTSQSSWPSPNQSSWPSPSASQSSW